MIKQLKRVFVSIVFVDFSVDILLNLSRQPVIELNFLCLSLNYIFLLHPPYKRNDCLTDTLNTKRSVLY